MKSLRVGMIFKLSNATAGITTPVPTTRTNHRRRLIARQSQRRVLEGANIFQPRYCRRITRRRAARQADKRSTSGRARAAHAAAEAEVVVRSSDFCAPISHEAPGYAN